MATNKSTPEKRLLELIESPTAHTLREVKKKRSRAGFLSLGKGSVGESFFNSSIWTNLAPLTFFCVCILTYILN